MPSERPLAIATIGACAAHAAVLLLAMRIAPSRPPTAGRAAQTQGVTEVDVEREAPTPESQAHVPLEVAARATTDHARDPRVTRAASAPTGANEGPSPAPSAPVVTAPPAASGAAWSFSAVVSPAPLPTSGGSDALDSATRAGTRAAVAEGAARDEQRALRDALAPRPTDRAILTGASGVLVPLTRDVVRRSHAPMRGDARLAFVIDAAGLVVDVHVVDASAERTTWSEVAQDLALEAHRKVVPVPKGARGVSLTLDVTSYLPSTSGVSGANELTTSSPLQERFDSARPGAPPPGTIRGGRSTQPRKLDLVIAPNQIDFTIRQGVGDLLVDHAVAAQRVVTVNVVDERAL
jgi:hypothetical protein